MKFNNSTTISDFNEVKLKSCRNLLQQQFLRTPIYQFNSLICHIIILNFGAAKMISDRLNLLFYFLLTYGCKLGAFSMSHNRKTYTVYHSDDKNVWVKSCYGTRACLTWLFFCFSITIHEFLYGEINRLILKVFVTFGATLLLTVISIPTYHSTEVEFLINGFFKYLRYIEGKLRKF